jgi:hypothetical protein
MSPDHLDASATSLRTLASLDRNALARRWITVFKSPVPRNAHVALLQGALAWHEQVAHEGEGNIRQLIRRLRRQAGSPASAAVLTPGTRLLREWQGQTHHVTVLSDGFAYEGKIYRSLTAIARQITGTAWSGPLFFGLRS